MSQQQDQPEPVKKALVVYGDEDTSLSKYVVAYLSGAGLDGIVFSRRADRYGCMPSYYDLVVVLNDAKMDEGRHSHVWNISTQSYQQAKNTTYLTDYTFKHYIQDKAKSTAEKIVSKLTGGRF